MDKSKYKVLTAKAVKAIALKIISDNGSTTNLETKDELRKIKYFATQFTVRDFMDEIIDDEPDLFSVEDVTTNGIMHRKFTSTDDTDDSDGSANNDAIQAMLQGAV